MSWPRCQHPRPVELRKGWKVTEWGMRTADHMDVPFLALGDSKASRGALRQLQRLVREQLKVELSVLLTVF